MANGSSEYLCPLVSHVRSSGTCAQWSPGWGEWGRIFSGKWSVSSSGTQRPETRGVWTQWQCGGCLVNTGLPVCDQWPGPGCDWVQITGVTNYYNWQTRIGPLRLLVMCLCLTFTTQWLMIHSRFIKLDNENLDKCNRYIGFSSI